MTDHPEDIVFMQKAIELAALGRFTTAPNPNVGALIVKSGKIIAEGFHQRAGEAHAEVNALSQLTQEEALGATCYLTLEPCSHFGRTPPCAQALKDAGVGRVVVSMEDPNPMVSGKGIALLRAAGIDVTLGCLAEQAEALNRGFFKRMREGMPWVKAKVASSLDGRTAMQNGESKWITGEASRRDVQIERACAQAIVTGVATVLADDPLLTVRPEQLDESLRALGAGQQQPLRVVLDTHGRMPIDCQLVQSATKTAPVLWVLGTGVQQNPSFPGKSLEVTGLETLYLPEANIGVQLRPLLKYLADLKSINTLMVEAGATLLGSFLANRCVDQWVHYQAPVLMGSSARALANIHQESLAQCPQFKVESRQTLGPDLKCTYRIEYPSQI
jgi:diaminohydroxyphosphoribosylaminopyrimidine deaminase/5-amino-6-(5-phosphoribosylamino)uracil reductase